MRRIGLIITFLLVTRTMVQAALPADQNAATHYAKAIQAAKLDDFTDTPVAKVLAKGWTAAQPEVTKWLTDNQVALQEIRDGSHLDKCQFLPPVGIMGKDVLPDYIVLAKLDRLLTADGLRLGASGKDAEALDSLLAALKLSLHLQQDRVLVARSIGLDLQHSAFVALLVWLETSKAPASVLTAAIPQASSLASLATPLSATVQAERAWTEATVDDMVKDHHPNKLMDSLKPADRPLVATQFKQVADGFYKQMNGALGATDFSRLEHIEGDVQKLEPHKISQQEMDAIQKKGTITKKHLLELIARNKLNGPHETANFLVSQLVPRLSPLLPGLWTGQVELRALPALLALKAFKVDHHNYPDHLSAIKILPQDPFSKGPMLYKRSGTGCLLYSVGPDGKDDGAKIPLTDFHKPAGTDIIMKLR